MAKLIITGATGTAGSEALRQAVAHPGISQITVLARRQPKVEDPKIKVIIHEDFLNYSPELLSQLFGHTACIWDLGISSRGMKEAEYTVITKDYALAAAKAFATLAQPPAKFTFCYLSGQGASWSSSRILFARVKGQAEKALAELPRTVPNLRVYSFRPAYIHHSHPVPDAGFSQKYVGPLLAPIFTTLFTSMICPDSDLAKGMIEVGLNGHSSKGGETEAGVFSNNEIKNVVKNLSRA